MPILQITYDSRGVEVVLEPAGRNLGHNRALSFAMSPQDAEDIRWYLEDFQDYPVDPTPKIARRIEQRMAELGRALFMEVLGDSLIWDEIYPILADLRVEIITAVDGASIPWELLRDPSTDRPIALQVASFVRRHLRSDVQPIPDQFTGAVVRILLVICRQSQDAAPFRSVALPLLGALTNLSAESFVLEALRPPTFQELAARLHLAQDQGKPFHIIHFDGHGHSDGICFEDKDPELGLQLVHATHVGKLLAETGVPIMVLNACRSAYTKPSARPMVIDSIKAEVRQIGSFAHELIQRGAVGVVAWQYSVSVQAAAYYMVKFYTALATGLSLGAAATQARKQLSRSEHPIQDWTIPVIFENTPAYLFPTAEPERTLALVSVLTRDAFPGPLSLFVGRDDTMHRIDRAFDQQQIVLLHGCAGSGKTDTAIEFGKWYQNTGGLRGPVLFTSFERYRPLPELLAQLKETFQIASEVLIEQAEAIDLLRKTPVLWIWDSVEPIFGFPGGSLSAWNVKEQSELSQFLIAASKTGTKFLLTSRRPEEDWLNDLPVRIELPPMTLDDQIEVVRVIGQGKENSFELERQWRPLLEFTGGNPQSLNLLIRQALENGLQTKEEIADFVAQLRAGKASFGKQDSLERTKSIYASLSYGWVGAFTESEEKQVSLLQYFQDFVQIGILLLIGNPANDWHLSEVKGMDRDRGVKLLERLAEIGLVTRSLPVYYYLHPGLPAFLRIQFERGFENRTIAATRALAEAFSWMAIFYHQEYQANSDVVAAFIAEEQNFLYALKTCSQNGWLNLTIEIMQGLRTLYVHKGQAAKWNALVESILPHFIDPLTNLPLPGREKDWRQVTEYRIKIAQQLRNWVLARSLLALALPWCRDRVSLTVKQNPQRWSDAERNEVHNLGVHLHALAQLEMEQQSVGCVELFQEVLSLARLAQDQSLEATCLLNLGHAYKSLSGCQDYDLAAQYYQASLDLRPKKDRLGRGRCIGELGTLQYLRCMNANQSALSAEERDASLSRSEIYHQLALETFPPDAVHELATAHHKFGNLYAETGRLDTAVPHYVESIHRKERCGDWLEAGHTRYNLAMAFTRARRLPDAHHWALAALTNYKNCDNTELQISATVGLIKQIESDPEWKPQHS